MLVGGDGPQGITDVFRIKTIAFRADGTDIPDNILSLLYERIVSLKEYFIAALGNSDPERIPYDPEDFLKPAVKEIGFLLRVEFDFYG